MKRSKQGRGLFYTRDSGGKHEMTPGRYVEWAASEAMRLGVEFSGNAATIRQRRYAPDERCVAWYDDHEHRAQFVARGICTYGCRSMATSCGLHPKARVR